MPAPTRRWPGVLLTLAGVFAVFSLAALRGVPQEARNERVLPSLNVVFEGIRDWGGWLIVLLLDHGTMLGALISGLALVVVVGGLITGGRRAAPLGLLTIALCAASWAQIFMFQDRSTAGVALYCVGIVAAIGLGIWCPMTSLPGFPPYPPVPRASLPAEQRPWQPAWPVECVIVFGLGVACILSRAWALTELSDFLDLENLSVMVQSRTWVGYLGYLNFGFVENNGGAVHPLPQEFLFRLFGTSIFMLRMAAVLWSTAGTLLMYWLVRRLGGALPAIIAALFFVAAPEQLFWGRSENTHFAPTAVLVLITLHLAVWMLQRLSFWSVLLVALWTPFSRFFYSAGIVLVIYPITVVLHALVFLRGAWRKAWWVLPVIVLGIGLWTASLTVMKKAIHPEQPWQFVHPAKLYGGAVWTKQGQIRDDSLPELFRQQAVSMSEGLQYVLHALTIDAYRGFSHWYLRAQGGNYHTTQNAGLVVLVALGMGYLIGQIRDRRAFALLALVGITVLPGILSADPAARRIAAIYPGFNAIAALFIAAALRLIRQRAGAALAWLAGDAAALGLAALLVTSMASHYALPIQPVLFGDHVRFAKPLFEDSDAIIHNVDPPALALVMVFGSLDRFLAQPPGFAHVPPGRWLRALLDPQAQVDFKDEAYQYTMWPQRAAELRETFAPKRITYLMLDTPATHHDVELTRALLPDAQVRQHHGQRDDRTLIAFTVDIGTIEALRRPSVWTDGGAPPPSAVMEWLTLAPGTGPPPAPVPGGGTLTAGGIQLDQPGWYTWQLDPPCPQATLRIDGRVPEPGQPTPMLPGVHAFELAMPAPDGCRQPVRLLRGAPNDGHAEPLRPQDFVSTAMAALPGARAATVQAYDGYGPARVLAQMPGQPNGFGVDGRGEISVLVREPGTWRLRRFAPDGTQLLERAIDFPFDRGISSVAVADDGTIYALTERFVAVFDRDGNRVATWNHEAIVWESELALWGREHVLINFPHRNAIAVWNRNGTLEKEVTALTGDPGKFYFPATLTAGPDGVLLIRQGDGRALLVRSPLDDFVPEVIGSFASPSTAHGAAFDGPDRIVIPDERALRTYDGHGGRLMATDPSRDLSSDPIPAPACVAVTPEHLLALDVQQNRVWAIAR